LITGYTRANLGELEAKGIIKSLARGKWPFPSALQAIITYQRALVRKRSSGARNTLAKMKAKELQQRIDIRSAGLVRMEEVKALVAKWTGVVRSELGDIPVRVTRDLQSRKKLEGEINAALFRVSRALAAREDETAEPSDGDDSPG
jgi:hypothetical protein